MAQANRTKLRVLQNLILACIALALWVLSFPPYELALAAWVALLPLTVIAVQQSLRKALIFSALVGLAVNVMLLSWLRFVTVAGWLALAAYLGAYYVLFALLLRYSSRKLKLPLGVLVPVFWVGLECARSYLFTGFPWFLLGHTQYRALPIIQIVDLVGVFGLSFLLAMVAGLASDGLLALVGSRRPPPRQLLVSGIVAVCLLLATLGYGKYRLATLHPTPGPKVALIQGNIPISLKHSPEPEDEVRVLTKYVDLTLRAASEEADLTIWPETMLPGALSWSLTGGNTPLDLLVGKSIKRMSDALPGHLLIGSVGHDFAAGTRLFNSAYYISPDGELLGRYDKIHLVVFGEYTPLQTPPLDRILGFLTKLRPPVMGPDLTPGALRNLFELGDSRFGVTICYEDTVSNLFRKFVRDGADFIVNISNDGWFQGSAEMDQHLAICVFRAVENRVAVARAANTGISSLITPTGEIQDILNVDGKYREVEGILAGRLQMVKTHSVYLLWGDLFGLLCGVGSIGLLLASAWRKG